jgi:hypothetical protein
MESSRQEEEGPTEENLETHSGGRSPRPEEKMAGSEGHGKEHSEMLHMGIKGMMIMMMMMKHRKNEHPEFCWTQNRGILILMPDFAPPPPPLLLANLRLCR